MSPERATPSNQEIIDKVPNWSEGSEFQQPKSVDTIIAEADVTDPEGRVEIMIDFLSGVEDLVGSGEVKSSTGEQYDVDDFRQRLKTMLELLNRPPKEGMDPLKLIPRDKELRTQFVRLLTNESTAAALMEAMTRNNLERSGTLVETDKTPERTEMHVVSEDLGETALDSVGIENPGKRGLDALIEGLSMSDIQSLRGYADALDMKRTEQKSGNGENSTYWGQQAGQYLRDLTPKARAVAPQYAVMSSKT